MLAPKHPKHMYIYCGSIFITLLLILRFAHNHHISSSLIWSTKSHGSRPLPPSLPLSLRKQSFPKKIWQSWKDDSENPTDRTVGFPHQWRVVNPDYQYERITDANMETYVQERLGETMPGTVETFSNLTDPIMRADMLRYIVMLADGGVWADIDVLPHTPISQWIPQEFHGQEVNLVVGVENDHNKQPIWPGLPYSVQLSQYTILAKPGHPAIATLIDRVAENLRALLESHDGKGGASANSFQDVMFATGPFVFTDMLMKYFKEMTGVEHNGDELNRLEEPRLIGDVLVLPKDRFGWLPHENSHGKEFAFVEHLFIGSWRGSHPG